MPSPRTLLFLTAGTKRIRLKSPPRSAHVGIWWHFRLLIVAILEPPQTKEKTGLIDSTLNHADEWGHATNAAVRCGVDHPGPEYFTVPRGRCLLHATTGTGLIYHGNQSSHRMLVRIARLFGFKKFETKQDDYYLMGPAADWLFDEEPNLPE